MKFAILTALILALGAPSLFAADPAPNYNMKIPKKGTVTATALHYRTGPAVSYDTKGTYSQGTSVTISESKNGWYKCSNGYWSSGQYINVTEWEEKEQETIKPTDPTAPVQKDVLNTLKTPLHPHNEAVKEGDLDTSRRRSGSR